MVSKILELNSKVKFINAVHSTAVIGRNIILGHGIAVMAGVIINSDSNIGNFCILNTQSILEHDGKMEECSNISSGALTGGQFNIDGV